MDFEVVQTLTAIKDSIDALAQPRLIDWLAVCVSLMSAVISGVAIWFAVRVPKKIAEQQNKIALFEKRYHAYTSLLTLQRFSSALNKEFLKDNTPDEHGLLWHISAKAGLCCLHFAASFGYQPQLLKDELNIKSVSQTLMILKEFEMDLYTVPFIFDFVGDEKDKIEKEISEIFEPLFIFMTEVTTYNFKQDYKINDKNRQEFIKKTNEFIEKYAESFEQELKI